MAHNGETKRERKGRNKKHSTLCERPKPPTNPNLLLEEKKMGDACAEQERVRVVPIQNWGTNAQKKEMKIQARGENKEQVDRLTPKKAGIAINSSTS